MNLQEIITWCHLTVRTEEREKIDQADGEHPDWRAPKKTTGHSFLAPTVVLHCAVVVSRTSVVPSRSTSALLLSSLFKYTRVDFSTSLIYMSWIYVLSSKYP